MTKHWAKLSCLFACTQVAAIGCIVVDDGEDTNGTTSTTSSGTAGSGGSGGSGGGGGTGASGGSGGSSATETTTSSSTVGSGGSTTGDSGTGDAGAGGAVEPVHVSDLAGLEDGEFHEGDPPASSGYDGEQISEITGPESVTNGGTFTIKVTVPGATGEWTFVVAVKGDSGYFTTTTASANEDGVFEIAVTLDSDVDLGTLTVGVAPTDAEGDVGDYAELDFDVITSGTGDVKITLSFDQDTDLDLHVIEPGDAEIYYGARESESGGSLDLDSNAGCRIDGTNIENIFWPPGSAPVGEYRVAVDYFQACVDETVNYTVTITIGDDVETFTGSFETDEAGAAETRRHEVATLVVE